MLEKSDDKGYTSEMTPLSDAQMDELMAKMSVADEEVPGDLTEDAITVMLDAVFYVDEEDHKNYAPQRDSLYWRLEEILTGWEAEGVDTTSLLKEFKEIMTKRKEIWHSYGSRDKRWQALCSIYIEIYTDCSKFLVSHCRATNASLCYNSRHGGI